MAWLAAIPLIGKVLDFAAKRWGYNPKEQELQEMANEIAREGNILSAVKDLIAFIGKYEGAASEVPKPILYLRCSWRPILQWGMTVKVLMAMFLQGKSVEEMKASIIFVGGLTLLRGIEKKFKAKE